MDKDLELVIKVIEVAYKAIKIIKEKEVNIWFLLSMSNNLESYNAKIIGQEWRKLTQEEHDLLRRVLG